MEKLLSQLQAHFPELQGGAGNRLFLVTLILTIVAAWGAQTGLFKFETGVTQYLPATSAFEFTTDLAVGGGRASFLDTQGNSITLTRNESAALQPATIFASSVLPSIGSNLEFVSSYALKGSQVFERSLNVFRADAFEILGNFKEYYSNPSLISEAVLRNFEELAGGLQINMLEDIPMPTSEPLAPQSSALIYGPPAKVEQSLNAAPLNTPEQAASFGLVATGVALLAGFDFAGRLARIIHRRAVTSEVIEDAQEIQQEVGEGPAFVEGAKSARPQIPLPPSPDYGAIRAEQARAARNSEEYIGAARAAEAKRARAMLSPKSREELLSRFKARKASKVANNRAIRKRALSRKSKKSKKSACKKSCGKKICNPKTKRCVKKSGKIGKSL